MLDILQYSYINKLSHIPSALSMLDYINVLFKDKWITEEDIIILGKPFGAQAYYLVWQEYLGLRDIEKLSVGVKHDEIDFVDYSEETIGNALGVASGIAMTTDKRVWVNLSDASLQMGNTLEAIQFIGQHRQQNIFVTIDWNNQQVTGECSDIIDISPIKNMFINYGWNLIVCKDGHDYIEISKSLAKARAYSIIQSNNNKPTVIIMETTKGGRYPELNSKDWHYRKISSKEELLMLETSCEKH